MINSTELLLNAEFALAAYTTLANGTLDKNTQRAALVAAGMSIEQAKRFSLNYSVVTQFNDTNTSFSATVFKDASGNLTLGIKGTLEPGDFVPTDANIALRGAGYDQIVAMYNWWQRVSTTAGQNVNQFQLTSYPLIGTEQAPAGAVFLYSSVKPSPAGIPVITRHYMEPASPVAATGELVDALAADADQKLNVTGHSLGAHLSLAFNTLFSNDTNDVTGFNTPGFINNTQNQDFFSALGGEVPTTANSQNVTNVIADQSGIGEQPWNAVAELHFEDNPSGVVINISIEDQWLSNEDDPAGARNHSQQILTDSLAVYNLLPNLRPH